MGNVFIKTDMSAVAPNTIEKATRMLRCVLNGITQEEAEYYMNRGGFMPTLSDGRAYSLYEGLKRLGLDVVYSGS
jgi:hypothetical protein